MPNDIVLVIPNLVKSKNLKVEIKCINPVFINDEKEYKDILNIVSELQKELNKLKKRIK